MAHSVTCYTTVRLYMTYIHTCRIESNIRISSDMWTFMCWKNHTMAPMQHHICWHLPAQITQLSFSSAIFAQHPRLAGLRIPWDCVPTNNTVLEAWTRLIDQTWTIVWLVPLSHPFLPLDVVSRPPRCFGKQWLFVASVRPWRQSYPCTLSTSRRHRRPPWYHPNWLILF